MGQAVLAFPAAPAGPRSDDAPFLGPPDPAEAYRALRERVAAARAPAFWPAVPPKPRLSLAERAGLVRIVETIPGACGEMEMSAVIEAMRHAPDGDVVEIGVGAGRAAALFAWLAGRYDVGHTLCVDPWSGGPESDDALAIFELNLAPLAQGRLNYLRAAPLAAATAYGPDFTVTTEAFGTTAYAGRIAVLHLNVARAETEAEAECAAWTPHLAPAGWVIFDDPAWVFGDAVRRRAEAFLASNAARIACHFTAGPAHFIELKR
jgi:SAM-dependent methyltransferase